MFDVTVQDIAGRLNGTIISEKSTPSITTVESLIGEYTAVVEGRLFSKGIKVSSLSDSGIQICRLVVIRLTAGEVSRYSSHANTNLGERLYEESMKMLDTITVNPDTLGEGKGSSPDQQGNWKVMHLKSRRRINSFNKYRGGVL